MPTLSVYIICGRNLPAEWTESSDPYVIVEYGHKHHKTKCDEDSGRNPNWNKTFEFELRDPPGRLDFKVYDADLGFDDFKGKTHIDVDDVIAAGGRLRNFYKLTGKMGFGHHGDIEVEVAIV